MPFRRFVWLYTTRRATTQHDIEHPTLRCPHRPDLGTVLYLELYHRVPTGTSGWLMLLLGVIVVVHGGVVLAGFAHHLGGASGPLMIVYSVVTLLN